MPATRAGWVSVVLCGLAVICGAIALVMFCGSVTAASVGGGATRPTQRCGSVVSPGPDYNPAGGVCLDALDQRKLEGGALAVGSIVFVSIGIERAVRQRRRPSNLPAPG
jgi:hypothetical protein